MTKRETIMISVYEREDGSRFVAGCDVAGLELDAGRQWFNVWADAVDVWANGGDMLTLDRKGEHIRG